MSVASAQSYAGDGGGRWAARHWPWLLMAALAGVLAYGPLLWLFFAQQWEKPHYQFFPFVILAFVWLMWQRYSQGMPRIPARTGGLWFDRSLLAAAFLLQAYSIALRSPWGAMASLILL